MLLYLDYETQLVPYHFQLFMPLLAINHPRPSVFLSVCACVCPCVITYWKFVGTIAYKPLVGISHQIYRTKINCLDFEIKKSKDQGRDENRDGKKSLVPKRTFPTDAYLLTVCCRGSSSFLNVPFFLLPSQMCHCFEMWLLPGASPAMGHVPPFDFQQFYFSALWSKSDIQLSKYCVVCKISWCRCQQLTALSISAALVTKLLVIEQLLHPALKFTVSAHDQICS